MASALDVPRDRLRAQRLVQPLATPAEVVAHLLAVQSQDFAGARWAVGQRARGATAEDVERAFDDGAIVRTHVLRPTWHFVAAADLRWLLALTAPRVHAASAYAYKTFGLTAAKRDRANAALADALRGGHHKTRDELAKVLPFAATGTALAHLMQHAELDAVIVSGARRGKHQTYALFDERIPPAPARSRDDALGELARRYIASHGPAQIKDFAWWSGLTVTEARRALELAGDAITRVEVGDAVYHLTATRRARLADPHVRLLPNFDELLVAFADRAAAIDPRVTKLAREAIFDNAIVSNGRVIGTYKVQRDRLAVVVACTLLVRPTAAERTALRAEVERYATFLGTPATLTGI